MAVTYMARHRFSSIIGLYDIQLKTIDQHLPITNRLIKTCYSYSYSYSKSYSF